MQSKVFFLSLVLIISACQTNKQYQVIKTKNETIMNGRISRAELEASKEIPWLKTNYNEAKPYLPHLNILKPIASEIKVIIVAGNWCSDTQRELPRFLKIADEIGMKATQYDMYFVDRSKKCSAINTDVLQITNVPTFIFFKDGKEFGRIIENTKNSFEEDLINLYKLM